MIELKSFTEYLPFNSDKFSNITQVFARYWGVALLVGMLLFFGVQYPSFLAGSSLNSMARQMAILLIASMGMSMIILMGSIDVSVGATLTFTGTIAGMAVPLFGPWALVIGILMGGVIGFSNGFLATKLKVPTFLSTIAMMGILNGGSALLLKGSPLNIDSEIYTSISKGTLIGNISNIVLIPIFIVGMTILVLKKTKFGRSLYNIGGNEYVSQYSGIDVVKTQILAFTIHGLIVGLAGSLQASVLEASCPYVGDPYTLRVIAVVVMGGIPLSGGRGGALGVVLGAMLIAVLESGLNFMGVAPQIRDVAMGVLIVLGAAANLNRAKQILIK